MNARKLAPLTGLLGVAFIVAAFVVGGETPDVDASTAKVVDFYTKNDTSTLVAGILLAYAAVSMLGFVTVLRNAFRRAEGSDAGASTFFFAGGILFAVGLAIFGGINFCLGDTPEKLDPATLQTLNVLNSDFFIPLAVGVTAFLLGSAIAILRTSALPRWLGWVALLIGIIGLTPIGFFAFLGTGLWVIAASIVLFSRVDAAPAPAAP